MLCELVSQKFSKSVTGELENVSHVLPAVKIFDVVLLLGLELYRLHAL
jgi:hypothetical protein